MKRKMLLILLAACLGLAACQGQTLPAASVQGSDTAVPAPESTLPTQLPENTEAPATEPNTDSVTEPAELPEQPAQPLGFSDFDSKLIAYLRQSGLEDQNFTVSPLSFKAALALTALGAEGETQAQILSVLGFRDVEEMTRWYASVLAGTAMFESRIFGEDKADCAYRVVNAIFHNLACDGEFRDSYKELVSSTMGALASSHSKEEITDAINSWVSDQTNGLIPKLVQDASKSAAVLVNALYLKTKWAEAFNESNVTTFTTADGTQVEKEFMEKTERFDYYEDENCQLVILPLQGGVSMALMLGESGDFPQKLEAVQNRKVHVTMPKFEVETSLENQELVDFLKAQGCETMFLDGCRDFDPMFTRGIHVDDIIQKSKVKVDEKGLEAAAATAVIMVRNTALPNPEEPVDFTADHPFQFAIYRQDESPELLFWGQVNN